MIELFITEYKNLKKKYWYQ